MEKELEEYICGKFLGSGVYRKVYVCTFDPTLVVKVAEEYGGRASNLLENHIWWQIIETPIAKWFSPVVSVSTSGKYLLQRRVEQLPKEQYPAELPSFFTDTKYSNFGHLKDKGFVCCDYGSFNLWRDINSRMKKVNWWG